MASDGFVREGDVKFLAVTRILGCADAAIEPWCVKAMIPLSRIKEISRYCAGRPVSISYHDTTQADQVKETLEQIEQQLVKLGVLAPRDPGK